MVSIANVPFANKFIQTESKVVFKQINKGYTLLNVNATTFVSQSTNHWRYHAGNALSYDVVGALMKELPQGYNGNLQLSLNKGVPAEIVTVTNTTGTLIVLPNPVFIPLFTDVKLNIPCIDNEMKVSFGIFWSLRQTNLDTGSVNFQGIFNATIEYN